MVKALSAPRGEKGNTFLNRFNLFALQVKSDLQPQSSSLPLALVC